MFPDKRSLKLLKSQSINVNWYQYCPETAVILLSTTVQGNVLQPLAFKVRSLPAVPDLLVCLLPALMVVMTTLLLVSPERKCVQDVKV